MKLSSRRSVLILAVAVFSLPAGVALGRGLSTTPLIGPNGTVTTCAPAEGGQLTVIPSGKTCKKGLTSLPLNSGLQPGDPAYEAVRQTGPPAVTSKGTFLNPVYTTVATLKNIPAGTYEILSKTAITDADGDSAECQLSAGGSADLSQTETHGGYDAGEYIGNMLLATLSKAGSAVLGCYVEPYEHTWGASDTSIIATQVSKEQVKSVSS